MGQLPNETSLELLGRLQEAAAEADLAWHECRQAGFDEPGPSAGRRGRRTAPDDGDGDPEHPSTPINEGTKIDNNLFLKADQLTTYPNTKIDDSLALKQNKFILGEIPANTSRLFY